ncbi:histamine H3 receptor-like [Diadema antillarum]|uniref:histamine H3 receptor-like n=1 Tax=Diadema antillarum TaxID=105358 RepID=UPI003A84EEBE
MANETNTEGVSDILLNTMNRNNAAFISRLTFSVFLSVLIVCSNGVVMATYLLVEDIRKDVTNRFIVNLSVADFMVGIFNVPFLADADFSVRWRFGEVFCKFRQALAYVITFVPVTVIILMSIFHNLRTSRKPRYRQAIKAKHVDILMAICWAGEAAFDFFLAFGIPAMYGRSVIDYDYFCQMEFIFLSPNFVIFIIILKYVLPLVILSFFCFNLFRTIRKISTRIHLTNMVTEGASNSKTACPSKQTSDTRTNQDTAPPGAAPGVSDGSTSTSLAPKSGMAVAGTITPSRNQGDPAVSLTTGNPRQRQASSFPTAAGSNVPVVPKKTKLQGHRKSALRLAVLVGAFLVFWTPVAIASLVSLACPHCVSPLVMYWAYMVVYMNSAVNPFLYALTNRQYRKGFAKVCRYCSNCHGSES